MKKLLILLCLPALILGGCVGTGAIPFVPATTNVAVTSYTVQGAETALTAASETVKLFLQLDHQNRALVKAQTPQIHAFAEKCRREFPLLVLRANHAKETFKANRTADGQSTLNSIMLTITQFAAQASTYTTQLQ